MKLIVANSLFVYRSHNLNEMLSYRLDYGVKGWNRLRFEEWSLGLLSAANILAMPKLIDKSLYTKFISFNRELINCEGIWCEKDGI